MADGIVSAKAARRSEGDENGGSRSVRRVLQIFEFMLDRGEPASMATLIDALVFPSRQPTKWSER